MSSDFVCHFLYFHLLSSQVTTVTSIGKSHGNDANGLSDMYVLLVKSGRINVATVV